MAKDYNFIGVSVENQSLVKYSQLLNDTFAGRSINFSMEYLQWLYKNNPKGHAFGFDAFDGSELCAHYVTVPIVAKVFGKEERGLLSLNTATHKNHQGKGLFVQLAERTYQNAAEAGYSFVVGVANQNSTHGFIKKLGFQLVSPLSVKIGLGTIQPNYPQNEFDFTPRFEDEVIKWRLLRPGANYCLDRENRTIYLKGKYPGFLVHMATFERDINAIVPEVERVSSGELRPKLIIGLGNTRHNSKGFFVDVPTRLKPSPLNFIFKSLRAGANLNKEQVSFDAFGFDAF